MEISASNNGNHYQNGNGYGFRIPIDLRRKIINKKWKKLRIKLEGESDYFDVNVDKKTFFSKGCGEIISVRIGRWLLKYGFYEWEKENPPKFLLEERGDNKYYIKMKVNTEKLAYWFFRLNGCFTFQNFVIHPESELGRGSQRTEIDIMAVRFPYRLEMGYSGKPMIDYGLFLVEVPTFYICEIKNGLGRFNNPLTNPKLKNMQRLLYAMGMVQGKDIELIADSLYNNFHYISDSLCIKLVSIGRENNDTLHKKVIQIKHIDVLEFIYKRFREYRQEKSDHSQWDKFASNLYKDACNLDLEDYIKKYS